MVTEINPEHLFFGAPTSLKVDGFETGATIDIPKVVITPTIYTPQFTNAKGKVKGTDIITNCDITVDVTVNEFAAGKIAWSMPGVTDTAGVFTWDPGRIPSNAYHDVVLEGIGLDGRTMVVTLFNAINVSPLELDWSNQAVMGMKLKLEARYDPTTPNHAPFSIAFDPGS